MPKLHVVRLTAAERASAEAAVRGTVTPAEVRRHARILLLADADAPGPARTDARVAARARCSARTVARIRARFAAGGAAAVLAPRTRPDRAVRKLGGDGEARLAALACSAPPPGHARWSVRLLADRLVALEVVDGIAPETVRQALKKTSSPPG